MSGSQTFLEEDYNPLTLGPSTLSDRLGNVYYTDEVDPAEAIEDVEFVGVAAGPPVQTLLTSGVYNGDFQLGPPRPGDPIDDMNPLPYWRFVQDTGGLISVRWVEDSSAPAGHALQWSVAIGAQVDDLAYIEQIVPVSSREDVRAPKMVTTAGAASQATWYRELQPVKYDGTTTGTAHVPGTEWGWLSTHEDLLGNVKLVQVIPDDARYLRIRIGVKIGALGPVTGADSASLREVWVGPIAPMHLTMLLTDVSLPATGAAGIYPVSANASGTAANLELIPGNDATPTGVVGWVEYISVHLSASRSTGTIEFYAWDDGGGGVQVGPAATIDGSSPNYDVARATFDSSTNAFYDGSFIRARAEVTSGTFSPTSADVAVYLVLALLFDVT